MWLWQFYVDAGGRVWGSEARVPVKRAGMKTAEQALLRVRQGLFSVWL